MKRPLATRTRRPPLAGPFAVLIVPEEKFILTQDVVPPVPVHPRSHRLTQLPVVASLTSEQAALCVWAFPKGGLADVAKRLRQLAAVLEGTQELL